MAAGSSALMDILSNMAAGRKVDILSLADMATSSSALVDILSNMATGRMVSLADV
jgi:hypothetical protein